jgi:poly(3-hydroxyalkanoate) synthetase
MARQGCGTSGVVVDALAAMDQGARPGEVSARKPGGGRLKPLEDAPGSYVKVSG